MRKFAKRGLALVLSVMMAAGMLTLGASAADETSFTDVRPDSSYAEAVEALVSAGVIQGVGDGKFAPDAEVNRATAITILGRAAGAEQEDTDAFSDVVNGTWYSGYVGWAEKNGIVEGDGQGHFYPDLTLTGAQMDTVLANYAKSAGIDYTASNTSTQPLTRGELVKMVYDICLLPSVKGTLYIQVYDSGPFVTKVIVTLTEAADSVSAEGATANTKGTDRKVTGAYLSDEKGNKVETASQYVTLELDPVSVAIFDELPDGLGNNLKHWVKNFNVNAAFTVERNGEKQTVSMNTNCIGSRVAPQVDIFKTGTYAFTTSNPLSGEDEKINIHYAAYEPDSLQNDGAKNPLIIWLHGGGEGGTDPRIVVLSNEAAELAGEDIQAYFTSEGGENGAYVLVPQCETAWMDRGDGAKSWGDVATRYTEALMETVKAYVAENGDVDLNRIYIGGCSNGGYMTINMMVEYPDYWAAGFPICQIYAYNTWQRNEDGSYFFGDVDRFFPSNIGITLNRYIPTDELWLTADKVETIKDIPLWFVHAAGDPIVVPDYTAMPVYRALVQAGAKNAWFSMFENALNDDLAQEPTFGHAVWQNFFNDQVKGVQDVEAIKNSAADDKTMGFVPSDATGGGASSNGYDSIFAWMNDQVNDLDFVTPEKGSLYIEGYEWGPCVTKVIVTMPEAVDSVSAEDAVVSTKGVMRTVEKAYLSDAEGNEVEAASKYVTFELDLKYATLSASSPFDNPTFFHNYWTPNYNVYASFTVEQGGETKTAVMSENCIDNRIAPDADQFTVRESYIGDDGEKVQYAATAPKALANDGVKNPLIIWLHGAGEGGDGDPATMEGELDIALLGNEAADLANPEIQKYFTTEGGAGGAYVLVPQCETMWMDVGDGEQGDGSGISRYTAALMGAIDQYLESNPDVDANRIYIGGCSNGGYMTVNMMIQYPDRWAAAYPVCEAYQYSIVTDEDVENIKDIPTWFVHCATDFVVNPDVMSKPLYRAMLKAGATNAWFSMYENVLGMDLDNTGIGFPHAIWQHVFNDAVKGVQDVEAIKNSADDDATMGFVPSDATNGGASSNGYDSIFAWMNAQVKK